MDVVVVCGGVGYAVSVSLSTMDKVPEIGQNVTLLTVFTVREDAFTIYGFADQSERDMFRLLTATQGVGGRTALGILSATTVADLQQSIVSGNIQALTRLPGIGKKTAERLVVELKDKVHRVHTDFRLPDAPTTVSAIEDAISALQALGFTRVAAEKSVKAVRTELSEPELTAEDIIRAALRTKT